MLYQLCGHKTHWKQLNIGSSNSLLPSENKLFQELMLTNVDDDTLCHQATMG